MVLSGYTHSTERNRLYQNEYIHCWPAGNGLHPMNILFIAVCGRVKNNNKFNFLTGSNIFYEFGGDHFLQVATDF